MVLPHLRTPHARLLRRLVGGTRWQQLRAHLIRLLLIHIKGLMHLLGVHLLLDECFNQLLSILVHQLLALVSNAARKVAAHKLHLALNLRMWVDSFSNLFTSWYLVNGGLVIKPLVDHGDGKLTHLARDSVVQWSFHL